MSVKTSIFYYMVIEKIKKALQQGHIYAHRKKLLKEEDKSFSTEYSVAEIFDKVL